MAILKLNQGHFHTGNFLMWQTDAKKKKKKATLYENAPSFLSAALRETVLLKPRSVSTVSVTLRTLPETQVLCPALK